MQTPRVRGDERLRLMIAVNCPQIYNVSKTVGSFRQTDWFYLFVDRNGMIAKLIGISAVIGILIIRKEAKAIPPPACRRGASLKC